MAFLLSVLDQSPIPAGSTAGDALQNTLDLARLADRLGYHRYWLAEHHGTPGLACNSPEVMIGPVAAATSNIRVGSGGIMLPHYSPLKVFESFSMLSSLYPGRIDLGLGRAPGTSSRVAHALQRDRRQPLPDDFREQLDELLGYIKNGEPEPYLLGSSPQSAVWAAELGLPYVFADFINPAGEPYAAFYREHFCSFRRGRTRHLSRRSRCAPGQCAPRLHEEAVRLSASARMMMLLLFRGQLIAVPPVEQALEFLAHEGAPMRRFRSHRRVIAGDPSQSVPHSKI